MILSILGQKYLLSLYLKIFVSQIICFSLFPDTIQKYLLSLSLEASWSNESKSVCRVVIEVILSILGQKYLLSLYLKIEIICFSLFPDTIHITRSVLVQRIQICMQSCDWSDIKHSRSKIPIVLISKNRNYLFLTLPRHNTHHSKRLGPRNPNLYAELWLKWY